MPPCDQTQFPLVGEDSLVVSILVLVDAALRLALTDYLVLFRSFNPCFSGCRPATHTIAAH